MNRKWKKCTTQILLFQILSILAVIFLIPIALVVVNSDRKSVV